MKARGMLCGGRTRLRRAEASASAVASEAPQASEGQPRQRGMS